eukprot:CAMPEP_0174347848 /NCGR_PEP_ID=MMETSP0811_2-20130205/4087_1 /TAXON_ID=73025 ORGANISM="Eutreptiella gymnastica-like, Strain CCMP1594" /NCGR_SAMPLE_ID=MMETSP0811_2 /ASSEMBLY_ACC=CAM_ASM_000667 /LENGTH=118 /DNA_ID=CAMNT_0015473831 /DNA_START=396 /DNA_END=752 /DNA_ORIENTATION=+
MALRTGKAKGWDLLLDVDLFHTTHTRLSCWPDGEYKDKWTHGKCSNPCTPPAKKAVNSTKAGTLKAIYTCWQETADTTCQRSCVQGAGEGIGVAEETVGGSMIEGWNEQQEEDVYVAI